MEIDKYFIITKFNEENEEKILLPIFRKLIIIGLLILCCQMYRKLNSMSLILGAYDDNIITIEEYKIDSSILYESNQHINVYNKEERLKKYIDIYKQKQYFLKIDTYFKLRTMDAMFIKHKPPDLTLELYKKHMEYLKNIIFFAEECDIDGKNVDIDDFCRTIQENYFDSDDKCKSLYMYNNLIQEQFFHPDLNSNCDLDLTIHKDKKDCDVYYVELLDPYLFNYGYKDLANIHRILISLYVFVPCNQELNIQDIEIKYANHFYITRNILNDLYILFKNIDRKLLLPKSSIIIHSFCAKHFNEDFMTTSPIGKMDKIFTDYKLSGNNKNLDIITNKDEGEIRKNNTIKLISNILNIKSKGLITHEINQEILKQTKDNHNVKNNNCGANDQINGASFLFDYGTIINVLEFQNEYKLLLQQYLTKINIQYKQKYLKYKKKYIQLNKTNID
jgi:hypothetical protein